MYIKETVDNNFKYHTPTPDNIPKFESIRNYAANCARWILKMVPDSPERTLALRKLEECVMWSNAGLARNQ